MLDAIMVGEEKGEGEIEGGEGKVVDEEEHDGPKGPPKEFTFRFITTPGPVGSCRITGELLLQNLRGGNSVVGSIEAVMMDSPLLQDLRAWPQLCGFADKVVPLVARESRSSEAMVEPRPLSDVLGELSLPAFPGFGRMLFVLTSTIKPTLHGDRLGGKLLRNMMEVHNTIGLYLL
jgi:hypothetical protein